MDWLSGNAGIVGVFCPALVGVVGVFLGDVFGGVIFVGVVFVGVLTGVFRVGVFLSVGDFFPLDLAESGSSVIGASLSRPRPGGNGGAFGLIGL